MGKKPFMTVLGKPFLTIGGQTHNSSSYELPLLRRGFAAVKALGGNTIAIPVPWDHFEPAEGEFNTSFVTALIEMARVQEVHLTLLWFGTWKNGTMEYTPAWVKRDTKWFPRAVHKDGTVIHQLSAHCEVTLKADKKAFEKLISTIKAYDESTQTVVAVQIENEAGILGGTRRDFSPYGQAAFESDVPRVLTEYCRSQPDSRLAALWRQRGSLENGNWTATFGSYGAEAVTAYAVASFIEELAQAGKALYGDLFLYTNAWLDGGKRGRGIDVAGLEWPSGGPAIRNLDIYYAVCGSLDAIAPDNYQRELTRYLEVSEAYANEERGWPLYVPESSACHLNASLMLDAFANHAAIGYHIFGAEGAVQEDLVTLNPQAESTMRSMRMLMSAAPLLERYRSTGRIHGIIQYPGEDAQVIDSLEGPWKAAVLFDSSICGRIRTDFRHRAPQNVPKSEVDSETYGSWPETGRGLLFQVSPNEFYLVGHMFRLLFVESEPEDGSIPATLAVPLLQVTNANYLEVVEGHFDENGIFIRDIVRSGDELRHGVWCAFDCGVIRIELAGHFPQTPG